MVGWPYKWRSKPDGAGYTTFLGNFTLFTKIKFNFKYFIKFRMKLQYN